MLTPNMLMDVNARNLIVKRSIVNASKWESSANQEDVNVATAKTPKRKFKDAWRMMIS